MGGAGDLCKHLFIKLDVEKLDAIEDRFIHF